VAITVLLLACVVLGSACAGAKGDTGPKGDTGTDGVGVESIVNNGDGTFTVKLTNGDSYTTDNLTGPQGAQGIQGQEGPQGEPGLPGAGVAWKGEWSNATAYSLNDGVGYQGSSYVSRQNSSINHVPTDTAWWDLWVGKGDTGDQGPQGIQGEPGPNMIVAMGSVNSNGSLASGFNVTSSVWNDAGAMDYYEITLDVTYESYWVTLVTPFWNTFAYFAYGASGGKLIVAMHNGSNYVQCGFSFMVLDSTP
jgi:hypothetical protein